MVPWWYWEVNLLHLVCQALSLHSHMWVWIPPFPHVGMDCLHASDYFIEMPFCLCNVCGNEGFYIGLVPKGLLSLGDAP